MRRLVPFGLAAALAGCASLGGGETGRVAELEKRVLELQRKAAMADVEIDRLERRLHQLEMGATPLATAAEPTPERPVREANVVAPVQPVVRVEASDLADDSAEAAEPGVEPGSVQAVPAAGQALYDQGYTLYHQGRTMDAEGFFQRFLVAYGTSDLADNAQFWIGACRLARGDAPGAAVAFKEAIERYPEGNKVPDALLKLGESLQRQGDLDGARASWQELVRRFPASDAAVVATGHLRQVP